MKIANQNTFQQFDKLRQTIFAHKRQQNKQRKEVKNPFSNKFRYLLPFAVLIGGGWLIYNRLPNLKDYIVQKKIVSYQQYLGFQSLKTFLRCKFKELFQYTNQKSNINFANDIYLTKLESDYLYLKQKIPEKLLDTRTKTSFSFWIFNLGIEETLYLINNYGDLVRRHKKYKFSLGGIAKIWGNTEQTIIKRNKIFEYYFNDGQKIEKHNNCQLVNTFTKMQYNSDQYEKALTICKEREQRVTTKIEDFIKKRIGEQQKQKIKINNPKIGSNESK